jgi:hypothetical protein
MRSSATRRKVPMSGCTCRSLKHCGRATSSTSCFRMGDTPRSSGRTIDVSSRRCCASSAGRSTVASRPAAGSSKACGGTTRTVDLGQRASDTHRRGCTPAQSARQRFHGGQAGAQGTICASAPARVSELGTPLPTRNCQWPRVVDNRNRCCCTVRTRLERGSARACRQSGSGRRRRWAGRVRRGTDSGLSVTALVANAMIARQ